MTSIEVLKEAVKYYKSVLEYNSLYIGYLLGSISEKEFEQEAEKYAVELSDKKYPGLTEKVKLLLITTGEQFTPSEIGDIFKINSKIAETILSEIKKEIENKTI